MKANTNAAYVARSGARRVGELEVMRSFDERTGYVLERGVDGKKRKRRVDVCEHENDRERAVEEEDNGFVREMQVLEKTVEDPVAAKNGFPGVTPDEIADPQRHDDKLVEKFLAGMGVKGQVVSKGVAK